MDTSEITIMPASNPVMKANRENRKRPFGPAKNRRSPLPSHAGFVTNRVIHGFRTLRPVRQGYEAEQPITAIDPHIAYMFQFKFAFNMKRERMAFRQLLLVGICLMTAFLPAGEPGRGSGFGEPTRRWVPAGPANVDAVTGQMRLNLPIGPTLPGRIPMGFVWYTEGVGASFDAYQWPTWESTA